MNSRFSRRNALRLGALAGAVPAVSLAIPGTAQAAPPTGTVRVYWLRPTDKAHDQRYPDGIAAVMRESQRYYRQELGVTFTLNDPVVEVVPGDHDAAWYENTPNGGEQYWWVVFNMQQELMRKLGLQAPDRRWINVGEISAEKPNVSGGGGGNGWVILSGHDADGAAGIGGNMNRWYGGMVHELGHAFGLPDSTSTDGTPMSASFYNYPNCHFNADQKHRILNGPYGSFLSGGGTSAFSRLRNVATGLVIDGAGRTANGSDVGQQADGGGTGQQWALENSGSYVRIKNRASGLYLDGMGRTENGANAGLWSDSGSTNQQWSAVTSGGATRFQNRATGLFLDGMGRTANGALGQWSDSNSTNQQWTTIAV